MPPHPGPRPVTPRKGRKPDDFDPVGKGINLTLGLAEFALDSSWQVRAGRYEAWQERYRDLLHRAAEAGDKDAQRVLDEYWASLGSTSSSARGI
jgi:hypothetical protein